MDNQRNNFGHLNEKERQFRDPFLKKESLIKIMTCSFLLLYECMHIIC